MAVVALVALVAAVGPALVHYVPLGTLRVVIGGLLLVFGLQWLRKAVLRTAGLKAKHDEDLIFSDHVAELSSQRRGRRGRDATAFTVAFKGVFLEGLEVVVIVLTLGATEHRLGPGLGGRPGRRGGGGRRRAIVARQLSGVPENALKAVGGRHARELRHLLDGGGDRCALARRRRQPPRSGGRVRGAAGVAARRG